MHSAATHIHTAHPLLFSVLCPVPSWSCPALAGPALLLPYLPYQ
ncbi:hypothetical protein CGRA01v4_03467 [Colletotrichum graminicola]|nr:hypothetical protein CGRA01v4_03467 [Colletotrichum graminicola]